MMWHFWTHAWYESTEWWHGRWRGVIFNLCGACITRACVPSKWRHVRACGLTWALVVARGPHAWGLWQRVVVRALSDGCQIFQSGYSWPSELNCYGGLSENVAGDGQNVSDRSELWWANFFVVLSVETKEKWAVLAQGKLGTLLWCQKWLKERQRTKKSNKWIQR